MIRRTTMNLPTESSSGPLIAALPVTPIVQGAAPAARPRLDGIDFLRGLVMVLMALDHTRDFFSSASLNPRDVHDTGLFLTRWITHFCAPTFILLAGVSACLYGSRGRSRKELARFLATRGAWLVLLELTVVRLAWTFAASYQFVFLQVLWVIGCSMLALAGLILLPRWLIATFAIVLIAGHNLADGIDARSLGSFGWLWVLVHAPGEIHPTATIELIAIYSLVPWVAVMALGYVLGPVFRWAEEQRRQLLLVVGTVLTIGFVLLRAANVYGDPAPWSVQNTPLAGILSFINCEKYPPSLLFLMMTLGPGLIVLALFRSAGSGLSRALVIIGRVPFLFYVAHIALLHALAIMLAAVTVGDIAWEFSDLPDMTKPEGFGLSLPALYALWTIVVLMLYPLCRWFAAVKQRRSDWWLSYL